VSSALHQHIVGSEDLGIRQLGVDVYALETCLLLRSCLKNNIVLIAEHLLKSFDIRLEAHGRGCAKRKTFPAGLLCNFAKSAESKLQVPGTPASAAYSSRVKRIDEDVRALSSFARRVCVVADARHAVIHHAVPWTKPSWSRSLLL
jgi:hypothetical protein